MKRLAPYGLAIALVDQSKDENLDHCMCHYIEGNDLDDNGRRLTYRDSYRDRESYG